MLHCAPSPTTGFSMSLNEKRTVFYLSDRTGITAENLGHSLMTQFDLSEFKQMTLPFINSVDKAHATVEYINMAAKESGKRPIIFSTTVNDEIRSILRQANSLFLDLFDSYLGQIESELQQKSAHVEGKAHGVVGSQEYNSRIDAMHFALQHDDGSSIREFDKADVILIAPSRCGKTPTCIYMAMQHGLYAANYPLTEEDLENHRLPRVLQEQKGKLYGLISDAERLHQVRNERRPGSKYASLAQTNYEIRQAKQLYQSNGIPFMDSTNHSIEEIATVIMQDKGLRRQSF